MALQQLNGPPHGKNTPCPQFVRQFLLRVQDVIDKYQPDIPTFDAGGKYAPGLGVWLGIPNLAPQIMAYYYNKTMQAHSGRLEGVVDLKEVDEPIWGTLTRDFEMGLADKLEEQPWQTEACISQWHYNRVPHHSRKNAVRGCTSRQRRGAVWTLPEILLTML